VGPGPLAGWLSLGTKPAGDLINARRRGSSKTEVVRLAAAPTSRGELSLDAPFYHDGHTTLGDRIASAAFHF